MITRFYKNHLFPHRNHLIYLEKFSILFQIQSLKKMTAREIRVFRNLSSKLIRIEERGRLLGILIARGVGLKEEEEFVRHEEGKLKCQKTNLKKRKEIVKLLMIEKIRDNKKLEKKTRKLRNRSLGVIEGSMGRNSRKCRDLRSQVRVNCQALRSKVRQKNNKKLMFLIKKYGVKNETIEELAKVDRLKYGGAKIFAEEYEHEKNEEYVPCLVRLDDEEEIKISDEEKDLLSLGPKFNVRNKLCEEMFLCEVEECVIKLRWEMMSEGGDAEKPEDEAYKNIELLFTDEENQKINAEIEEEKQIEDAKSRLVFDPENLSMNLSKRRTTDLKGNARVIFPKRSKNFETEAKIETFRVQALAEFRKFLKEKCKKGGKQPSNLSKKQERGLKSLTERVKNGEIVVVPTDKSGKFAIMSRRAYEESGNKHVKDDLIVGWDELKEAQTRLNGHVAMMVKIFKIGKNWEHQDRIRETMMGESLSVCPVSLLYKDHKGWKNGSGTIPPTRSVAGGHVGMNMHLSEIISDILEPIVETLTDGDEVISTEDLVANIEDTNEENEGWNRNRWWGNITEDMYEVCTDCEGSEDYVYDRNNPELCKCFRFKKPSSTPPQDVPLEAQLELEGVPLALEFRKVNLSEESEKPLRAQLEREGDSLAAQNTTPPQEVEFREVNLSEESEKSLRAQLEREGDSLADQNEIQERKETTRTTIRFMKLHRRAKWEARMGWDPNDKSRIISSKDVNPEDLQDFMTPMVLVGTDVESLYPNLKVAEVSKRMKEAILESEMKWEDIDYMEAARYVALNWDEEKCRKSKLRKILPRRRGKTGARPGIKGAGPRGRLRGDQEQWIFDPKAKLTDDIKKELLATVVEIVTEQLFKHHYYTFGGQIYHQQDGGSIGLRGTCANI